MVFLKLFFLLLVSNMCPLHVCTRVRDGHTSHRGVSLLLRPEEGAVCFRRSRNGVAFIFSCLEVTKTKGTKCLKGKEGEDEVVEDIL